MEFENLQIEVPTHDDPSQSQLFGIKIYVRVLVLSWSFKYYYNCTYSYLPAYFKLEK